MAAGMCGRVRPDQGEEMFPMGVISVVMIHDFHLTKVDSLEADVYVAKDHAIMIARGSSESSKG